MMKMILGFYGRTVRQKNKSRPTCKGARLTRCTTRIYSFGHNTPEKVFKSLYRGMNPSAPTENSGQSALKNVQHGSSGVNFARRLSRTRFQPVARVLCRDALRGTLSVMAAYSKICTQYITMPKNFQ